MAYDSWGEDHWEVYENSSFTKESFAQWFYDAGDVEKANILVPNFIPDLVDNMTEINSLQVQNKKLLEEIEQLKNNTEAQEPTLIQDSDKQEIDFDNYANYLPVKGKSMNTLSSAFQSFPTRFENYLVVSPPKVTIKEWLGKAYSCNERNQDVFANILLQNFLRSN
jgi:hypothetical protein